MVGGFKSALLALVLLAGAGLLMACGGGSDSGSASNVQAVTPTSGQLEVTASDFAFGPNGLLLTAGEQVTITLRNDGRVLHNLSIEDMPADVLTSESSGPLSADEGEAFVGADTGATGTLALVPLESGTYTFVCTVQGHDELGMQGTIIVREGSP